MDISALIYMLMNLDQNVLEVFQQWGMLIHLIIFASVLGESVIVLASFVPGEPLIFVVGTLARVGYLNIILLFLVMSLGSIAGYIIDYWLGYYIGPKIFSKNGRFFKVKSLEKTQEYFKKYGIKTVFISRFIPLLGVFGPLVAGAAKMDYKKFMKYNIISGSSWVLLWLLSGYFLG